MILHTIQGDDAINELCMAAMTATMYQLMHEKVLTEEQVDAWLKEHVCAMMHKEGGWHNWFARLFGGTRNAPAALVKVLVAPDIRTRIKQPEVTEYDEGKTNTDNDGSKPGGAAKAAHDM